MIVRPCRFIAVLLIPPASTIPRHMPKHMGLAYSGGLDTSIAIHWLKNHFGAKVTAVLVDVGQPLPGLEDAQNRACHNGAEACIVVDAKQAFAEQYVAPAILANARYEDAYPLATALGRPLIAAELVRVAREVGADAIAHGCTGKGNDQVRIESTIHAIAPDLEIVAPQRSHPMNREIVLEYAAQHQLSLPPRKSSPFSVDENLWGRSAEGNELEDPSLAVPEAAYAWTQNPAHTPAEGVEITLQFQEGLPVSINGQAMPLADLILHLNQIAGDHGIGRIDHLENRLVGIKSREVYEAPAALTILAAKKALEDLCLTREESRLKPVMEQKFAHFVYDGLWQEPAMQAVQAFIGTMQSHVEGTVTLHLVHGRITVLGRSSPKSLYDTALATYGHEDQFHHQAAEGFIEIWALPQKTAHRVRSPASTPTPPATIQATPANNTPQPSPGAAPETTPSPASVPT